MPTGGWPMLLHDPLHSGLAAGFGPTAYDSAWSQAGLGSFGGVAVGTDGKVYFGSAAGSAYCYDATGNRVWAYLGKYPFLVNPPAIDPTGTVHLANGDVVALDPATGTPVWTYARPTPTTLIAAPLAVDAEGRVYVSTTTASGQPNELLAIKAGALLWSLPLPRPSTSTPAIAADGTVCLGCADGVFRALDPSSGKVKWSWSEAGASLPMPPAVGPDGTVYVGVQGYPQTSNALVALTPPPAGQTTPTVRWRYSPTPGEYLSGRGAPAVSADGTVYVGFEALHAIGPAGTKLWSSPATATETSPGPPAVAVDGTVHFVTAAGTLWAIAADGTLRWQTAPGIAAPAAPPALAGAVYFGDGVEKLSASTVAAPLSPRLTALYQALVAAREPAGQGRWTYTLSAQTIPDAPLLALVTTATGASGPVTVVGPDLQVADGALTLSGSVSFLGIPASADLVFAMAGETEVTLSATATTAAALRLPQAFPPLAGTLFEGIAVEGATLSQVGTTGQPAATSWTLGGSVEPTATGSPLAESASILGITGKVALAPGGTITLTGGVPVVALSFVGTYAVTLVGGMAFQCGLGLETSIIDPKSGSLLATILITSHLTVAGQPLAVRAEMPSTTGMVILKAEPGVDERPQVKLTDLNLWHGSQGDLTAAVPSGPMQEPTQTFGLEWIALGFRSDKTLAWISFRLGAPKWQVLSAHGVGVDLAVEEVGIEITCADPFGEPQVGAVLGGTITTTIHTASGGSTAAFEIGAVAPDFQLYGQLQEGTEVRLADVVSAVAGTSVTLPSEVPSLVLDELGIYSQPQYGTFDFNAGGDLDWTLFKIGAVKFALRRFGIVLARVQTVPDGSKPAISANLQGTVLLGGFEFEVGGYSPAGSEGWQLEANLGAPVALPTIGDLVETFNPAWVTALPTAVADAGQDIELKVLGFEIEPAPSTKRSLQATIGTAADWAGWTVIETPRLALTAVDVDLTAASDTGFKGAVRGGFALGGGTIALAVPLPFASGKFTLAYDSGNEGLTLPSIGAIAGWVEPAWTLPAEVGSIGSGLDLDRFTFALTIDGDERTIDVFAAAADPSHRWVLVPGSPQPLLALEKVTVEFHDAKTSSGAIAGTVAIGSGALPLRATMQNSWSSYTIGLDTKQAPVTLPTLHDIVSLLSRSFADAIPEPMRSWGSGIQVSKFQVAISTAGQTTATIEAAVGEPAGSLPWTPLPPLSAFELQALAVQVSGTVGALPEVGVIGTIVIGQHGRIPLKAGFSAEMKKVAVALDPGGGPATLPTIGDVAKLFVGSWATALPPSIADLGESFVFQKLDLEYDATGASPTWSVEIAIGTAPTWAGYAPIPAMPSLRFTSLSIGFEKSSAAAATGKLQSTLQVMGRPVTFELDLPEAVFKATLDTGLTLLALAQYVIGSAALLPSWLEHLGLPKIQLEANFKTEIYILRAIVAMEIPLPVGSLEQASLSGEIGGPDDPRVCFEATWVTPGGAKVPGRICYPFADFFPRADPQRPIEDFPPEEPPSDPPDYKETSEVVERLLGDGASAGEAASIAYWSYGATAAATAGALLAAGIAVVVIAKALKETQPADGNPTKLAEDLVAGAALAGRSITPAELGAALAEAFADLTVAALVAALAAAIPTITFRQMVEGLKGGRFQPHQISAALRSRYTATAATMVAELKGGWAPDAITATEMVAALAAASYTAVEAAPVMKTAYPDETKTGPEFARLFLAAGFAPALDPAGMAAALRAAPFGAVEAAAGLLAAYPSLTRPLDTVPYLRAAGYTAAEVAPVILAELKTAAEMAKALAAGGYTAPQAAPALKASYPTEITDPAALFAVLVGAWTGLTAADAAAASASAGYEPAATAQALHKSPVFGAAVSSAAAMTTVLKGAYPAIGLPELLAALAGVPFPAFAAAAAAIPAGTPVTTAVTALSASTAYPNLEPLMLAAALAAARYVATEVEAGLVAKWAQIPALAKQRAAAAVVTTEFATALGAVASAQAAGKSAAEAARERLVAQPTLAGDALAAAIQAVYPFAAPALEGLARAIVPAFTQPADPAPLALTLLVAAPTSAPATLATALLAGFAAAPALPSAEAAAKALAAAYAAFGAPTSESPLAAALVGGYALAGSPLKPGDLAAALKSTFPTTTITKVITALKGAYQDPWILPPAAASATAAALAVSKDEPLELAAAIAGAYGLEECPVDTGAISLAMKVAGMDYEDVSGAFRQILRNWTVDQYGLLVQIYQEESWTDAWLAANGGEAVPKAAEALHQQYPGATTGSLLAWLVAGYDLTAPLAAATPIATGLKQIGVAEAAALSAFQTFFGSAWTAAATAAVHAVYNPSPEQEVPMASNEQQAEIELAIADAPDLPTAAWGCKNGGFTALECLPELQKRFPTATIGEVAAAAVGVWACEASKASVEAALTSCQVWTAAEVAAATAANLHLVWHDLARFKEGAKPTNLREVGLFQGDLTTMASAETVSILVISALPGDLSPTPGSMIAALAARGVSVEALSKTPAHDFRAQYKCWISQAIPAQSFDQLLVLETTGAEATANIPGVFSAIAAALPSPPDNLTVATSMLSTGSAGAQPVEVLTALFDAAKASMEGGYKLTGLKVVIFAEAWVSELVTKFDELKGS